MPHNFCLSSRVKQRLRREGGKGKEEEREEEERERELVVVLQCCKRWSTEVGFLFRCCGAASDRQELVKTAGIAFFGCSVWVFVMKRNKIDYTRTIQSTMARWRKQSTQLLYNQYNK